MKYKVGDKVRVKSLEWYNANKNPYGSLFAGGMIFVEGMSKYCGSVLTVIEVFDEYGYDLRGDEDWGIWTDEMIEGLVEEAKPGQSGAFDFYGMSLMEEKEITTNLYTTWKITRVPGGVIMRERPAPNAAYVFVPLPDKKEITNG